VGAVVNELEVKNLRILAERLGWPFGAAEECERIGHDMPGWHAGWQHAWRGRPAGFYAYHDDHYHLEPEMYGATPDELRRAIEAHRCPRWQYRTYASEPGC
jgi:hypothetical protein